MSDFLPPEQMSPAEREAEIAELREERAKAEKGEILRGTAWRRLTLKRLADLEYAQGKSPVVGGGE